VGFLTGLRVYSVICAVSFYRRVRKGITYNHNIIYQQKMYFYRTSEIVLKPILYNFNTLESMGSSDYSSDKTQSKDIEDFLKHSSSCM
jgi:hypothetical protein